MNEEERKNTPILIIEKDLKQEHLIYAKDHFVDPETRFLGMGQYLYGYGFSIELVPSALDYVFDTFETFKKNYNAQRKDAKCASRPEDFFDIFRKEPIHAMDDLTKYEFIFAHADMTEYRTLDTFSEKHPSIPIIFPSGSLKPRINFDEFSTGVTQCSPQMYIITDDDRMGYNAIQLIEKLKK
ncbi:MAG: hypothetical protein WC916_07690 [Candidatus Woesearchaeota archaeon]